MLQWLGLCAFIAGARVRSLIWELRSRKPCGVAKKKIIIIINVKFILMIFVEWNQIQTEVKGMNYEFSSLSLSPDSAT